MDVIKIVNYFDNNTKLKGDWKKEQYLYNLDINLNCNKCVLCSKILFLINNKYVNDENIGYICYKDRNITHLHFYC